VPTEFVRIRDKNTSTESSVPRRRAEQLAGRGGVDILDKKAVNALGEPLPAAPAQDAGPAGDAPEPPAGSTPIDPPTGTTAQVATGAKSKEQAR